MDVTSYCNKLEKHLTEWKAMIYDVIRTVDGLPEMEKESQSNASSRPNDGEERNTAATSAKHQICTS